MKTSAPSLGRVIKSHIHTFVMCFVLLFALVFACSDRAAANIPKLEIKPVHVNIESLGINLPVKESGYDYSTREWEISNSTAHFAKTTAGLEAKSGATLIYAHNTPGLFGATDSLKTGDEIKITGSNGRLYTYLYKNDSITSPTDGSIFRYNGPAQLTLLCCYGKNSEQRRLMYFSLARVE